jgi:hypothetical protein
MQDFDDDEDAEDTEGWHSRETGQLFVMVATGLEVFEPTHSRIKARDISADGIAEVLRQLIWDEVQTRVGKSKALHQDFVDTLLIEAFNRIDFHAVAELLIADMESSEPEND